MSGTSLAYDAVAVIIFIVVSYCFFLPCNRLIPLDRRSAALIGATLCYATRSFGFPSNKMDIVDAIDFDVLALLAGIMAINFIMVHQKESKSVIRYVQTQVQNNPRSGFWLVSVAALSLSPFLTNDGICLLFVEPILNAFESLSDGKRITNGSKFDLQKGDAFYFLLALACSANIGSSLTYTGNPQNMIVGEDAVEVLSPARFLLYMCLPTLTAFVVTILWIERCWIRHRCTVSLLQLEAIAGPTECKNESNMLTVVTSGEQDGKKRSKTLLLSPYRREVHDSQRRRKAEMPRQQQSMVKRVVKVIVTPFPYAMLLIMSLMIAMLFVDIMSISGLVCLTAVVMVVTLVLGNHLQGLPLWGESNESDHGTTAGVCLRPMTVKEKADNANQFFEELFDSIDYNLLMIFLGLFVVVENIDSTGLPRRIWNKIVGRSPFDSVSSVVGISIFILVTSQFLGNVAVVQLAKPNVEVLDDAERKYAWAMISFVATVGGNLTITGSAANIIVAEKANRIDPENSLDFFRHYAVCFWVTLLSCALGALMITGIVVCDNGMIDAW